MADYTPTLGDFTELKPFRFWCQKVLPLVYDDSLSYYELLCKVVDYLNKTMEDVDTMHDDVVDLHAAYVQLQTYVNTYFDNLDVQEEINNKLNEMALDGSLTTLINPFIPDIVTDWLNEHITPTTPAIDDTLTVSGAGADAKKTGDAIANQYNSSNTYKVGDYVLYQGTVYRCISNIDTAELWNSNHWTSTKIGNDVSDLKSALSVDETSTRNYLPYSLFVESGTWTNTGAKYADISKARAYFHTLVPVKVVCEGYNLFFYQRVYGSGSAYSGTDWLGSEAYADAGNECCIIIKKDNVDDLTSYISDIQSKLIVTPQSDLVSSVNDLYNSCEIYNIVGSVRGLSYVCEANGNNTKKICTTKTLLKNHKYLIRLIGDYNYGASSQCTICIGVKGHNQGDTYYQLIDTIVWTKPTKGTIEYTAEYTPGSTIERDFGLLFLNGINNAGRAGVSNVAFTVVDVGELDYPKTEEFYRAIDENEDTFIYNGSASINKNIVDCFGDSLTSGVGGTPYPTELATILGSGYSVNNYGVGGESTLAILSRLGAIPAFVSPFTADETADIEITPITCYGYGWQPNIRAGKGMNPATICGVKGNIYTSDDFSHIYFRKFRYEDSKTITRPSLILTNASFFTPYHSMVLFMGQNGGWTGTDPEGMLIQQYKQAESFMKSNNYIFVGLTTGTSSSRSSLELKMANNFGGHYFNARDYLVNYGLADNSLTPTAADEAAIAEGAVPPQLMNDSVHLNTYGYSSLAKGIYNHGKGLGMWD